MIRIEISKDGLDRAGHETLVGRRMIESLRAAGIPVLGEFAFRGVQRGTIAYAAENDLGADVHVFVWSEDENDNSTKGFVRTNLKNGSVVYKNGRHAEDDEL